MTNIKKGFSLLEIILVVAILALVGLIGVPRIAAAIAVMTLQTEAQKLKIWVRRAKYEAIATGNTHRVDLINPSTTKYRIQYFDNNDNNQLKTIEEVDFANGITAESTRAWIDFDSLGIVSGGGMQVIAVRGPGLKPRLITLTQAGQIK